MPTLQNGIGDAVAFHKVTPWRVCRGNQRTKPNLRTDGCNRRSYPRVQTSIWTGVCNGVN